MNRFHPMAKGINSTKRYPMKLDEKRIHLKLPIEAARQKRIGRRRNDTKTCETARGVAEERSHTREEHARQGGHKG